MKKHILTALCAIGFSLMMPTANAADAAVQTSFDAVVKDYQNNPTKFAASELSYYNCDDKTAKHFERMAKTFNRAVAYYYDFRYLLDGESLYAPSQRLIQKVGGADSFFDRLSMEQLQMMSNAVLNALSAEDKQSVKLLLETLQKRQVLFQNFITPENDKLLKLVEKTVHYINADTLYELGLPKTNACYGSSYYFNNVPLMMSKDASFEISSLDFQLYSFWLRRHRAGTTEKAKQLLDYALSQLSDIPSLEAASPESNLSATKPQGDSKRWQPPKQKQEKLHPNIAQFNNHQLLIITKKFKVRIDEIAADKYRYAGWSAQKSIQEQPDIVLNNGKMYLDNAKNTRYAFHKGSYTYEVVATGTDKKQTLPAYLIVRQGKKEIVNQQVKIIAPSLTAKKATTTTKPQEDKQEDKRATVNVVKIALEKLRIDKDSDTEKRFIVHKVMPSDPDKTIVVIPQYGKVEDNRFTLKNNILIINNKTGEVTHQYVESDKTTGWESDAMAINAFAIDTAPYQISASERAFGIVVTKSTHLALTEIEEKELSLFVPTKTSLKKVMTNCQISHVTLGCAVGEGDSTSKTVLIMTNQKTNGYFDIRFKQNNTETSVNDTCEVIKEKNSVKKKISQFKNGSYQCVLDSY